MKILHALLGVVMSCLCAGAYAQDCNVPAETWRKTPGAGADFIETRFAAGEYACALHAAKVLAAPLVSHSDGGNFDARSTLREMAINISGNTSYPAKTRLDLLQTTASSLADDTAVSAKEEIQADIAMLLTAGDQFREKKDIAAGLDCLTLAFRLDKRLPDADRRAISPGLEYFLPAARGKKSIPYIGRLADLAELTKDDEKLLWFRQHLAWNAYYSSTYLWMKLDSDFIKDVDSPDFVLERCRQLLRLITALDNVQACVGCGGKNWQWRPTLNIAAAYIWLDMPDKGFPYITEAMQLVKHIENPNDRLRELQSALTLLCSLHDYHQNTPAGSRIRETIQSTAVEISRLADSLVAEKAKEVHENLQQQLAAANIRFSPAAISSNPAISSRNTADTNVPNTVAGEIDESRKEIMHQKLIQSDNYLNNKYNELRKILQPAEEAGLRATQRTWIKTRDKSCGIDNKIQQDPSWLQIISTSETRSRCVLQANEKRSSELTDLHKQINRPLVIAEVQPKAASPAYETGSVDPQTTLTEGYVLSSLRSHQAGKYYFEVVIDEANAGELKTHLVARIRDTAHWTGTTYDIQSRNLLLHLSPGNSLEIVGGNLENASTPQTVLGIAVDLDNGRLYLHRDGEWLDGIIPGMAKAMSLKPDGLCQAEIQTDIKLTELQEKGVVHVNFGSKQFRHTVPAGYRGFDWPDHLTDSQPAEKAELSTYPSDKRIAGNTQVQWLQRYWEWARSFPLSENPAADPTGARCSAGQSGPVWFLTGSKDADPVQRECEIPAGKILLIPIMNTLAQSDNYGHCDQLLIALRQFGTGVSDLFFRLDGTEMQNLDQTMLGTGCFKLKDTSTGKNGLAAGIGYWFFLPPLKQGRHVLEFGGRFTTDGFRQNISYILHIR